jgi:hypothetical protein
MELATLYQMMAREIFGRQGVLRVCRESPDFGTVDVSGLF